MKKNFKIIGMSCNNCVGHVEKGLTSLPGVDKVKVNLKKGQGTVKFDESLVTEQQIIAKVAEVGYQAEVI